MPDPSEIRATVNAYLQMMCDTQVEGIMELFAEDATVEDPVGGEVIGGKQALRDFYGMVTPMLQVKLGGPICVSGNQCAFPVQAQLTMDDTVSYVDATDVFVFDEAGKITSMRAFWNPQEMRPQP